LLRAFVSRNAAQKEIYISMQKKASGVHFRDARAPEGVRLYAIGDIHGRLDLLEQMHARIAAEIERDRLDDWLVVHLGDYIDRGANSRGVIEFLIELRARDARYITLAGNHDLGLLEFLAGPEMDSLFIQYGGIETAASYGVSLSLPDPDLHRYHRELLAAVPREHIQFVLDCGFSAEFGDFFFCHAGIRPGVPLDLQDPDDLVWIRKGFLDCADLFPKVVVHGHTITRQAELLANRVNIDTGAYRSDVLTALVVDGGEKRLLTATGSP
jgi:serine/threonine protein phosphatase 1